MWGERTRYGMEGGKSPWPASQEPASSAPGFPFCFIENHGIGKIYANGLRP